MEEIAIGWTGGSRSIYAVKMNDTEHDVAASRHSKQRRDRFLLVCTLARTVPVYAWLPGPWLAVGVVAAAVWVLRR